MNDPQCQAPPFIVQGIELATREDITITQRANATMINALREDLRDVETRLTTRMDTKFAEVDAQFDTVNARLDKMDGRLDKMDGQLTAILAAVSK
ncbi:hypothetical protein [Nonomuraea rhizosphaerae]|uniref:hypothetical protein n=1 Tax=Nonomuraea rhizosphaerae TaxID=2665663 RepID=UPI001C5D1A12|nr:hypothetical protein [Nonomuraea rhizosphaerae]